MTENPGLIDRLVICEYGLIRVLSVPSLKSDGYGILKKFNIHRQIQGGARAPIFELSYRLVINMF